MQETYEFNWRVQFTSGHFEILFEIFFYLGNRIDK